MIFISHRGNIKGPNFESENNPNYILETLELGYDVEIDVWFDKGDWFLGHDYPQYIVEENFLLNPKFWLHCKNEKSLELLNKFKGIKYFWHNVDDYTLTSESLIWVYPGKKLLKNSISCLPEQGFDGAIEDCVGICSDYIEKYKNEIVSFKKES